MNYQQRRFGTVAVSVEAVPKVPTPRVHKSAVCDQIDYDPERKINKDVIQQLRTNAYIQGHRNVVIGGPTGAGKSFISQALGINACQAQYHVRYIGMYDLMTEFAIREASPQSVMEYLKKLTKPDVLIIDDFMMTNVTKDAQDFILKLMDSRNKKNSTIVSSQLMEVEWRRRFIDRAIGEAAIDRLVHNAFTLNIEGKDMREKYM
ncbi:ATP-binding protein [Galactobacillus timonensis]|uniref:ATP-binding protein n=1 Tax=Galactobacillus timonensis TaxID=2041840 RepID=UPI0014367C46|nr:ATP-binding protein [Galactobacillus timonensis]